MAAILVYGELSEGKVTSTSLEIVSKARELGDVYAVALGSGAKAAAATLGKHGAKAVHVNEDKAFDDYIAEPATDALASLFEKEKPDLILFGFTPDSREVAGRRGPLRPSLEAPSRSDRSRTLRAVRCRSSCTRRRRR